MVAAMSPLAALLLGSAGMSLIALVGGLTVLLPRRWLHDRCAGSKGEVLSPGLMWSASHGSFALAGSPQMWQFTAVCLTILARRL